MKQIKKEGCHPTYTLWCKSKSVVGTYKEDYDEIPPDYKNELKAVLIKEQGFICGYTMKRIDQDTSHIEHIKPQHICKAEQRGLDLDYNNMIACYPKNKKVMPLYGAHKKDGWWDDGGKMFVSPLKSGCESHFHFCLDGNIKHLSEAGETTINVLALNDKSLSEERKRVIDEFIYGSDISEAKTTRLISNICDKDGRGRYREFCIAIRDALQEHLKTLEKRARKKKYARRA